MKPILYDLYCKAGGASRGYQLAGYEVTGVDIEPQPNYVGDVFIQSDALAFVQAVLDGKYPMPDLWAASPPCQAHMALRHWTKREYPDLVPATRAALVETGKPYAIENVPGAPLVNPIALCGSMFGLRVIRHRIFECSPPIWFPPGPCSHPRGAVGRRGNEGTREWITVTGHFSNVPKAQAAMGIDWMTQAELAQAIPPAYTRWIGEQMLQEARIA